MTENPNVVYEDKWLMIIHSSDLRKTKVYEVLSKSSKCHLGVIQWHRAWRNYCFFPDTWESLVFSDRCLQALSDFVNRCNIEHKEGKQ